MPVGGILTQAEETPAAGLERLLAAMDSASSPRLRLWSGGGAGLGCCGDGALARPDGTAGMAAVLDGRIDNRGQILRDLGMQGRDVPDPDLPILAYTRWGEDFLDRFAGDFACAVWDGAARRLVLGRSPMGLRPLHHWSGGGLLLFASEPRGLLADPRVPRALDERALAAWLALLPQRGTATLYRDIERVPPGHVLVVEKGTRRLYQFWHPERIPILRLRRDEDYAEALRTTLDEAVRCRLPDSGMVGTMLSSGLDSPSVTALAARHLAARGRRLTSFTAVPGRSVDDGLHSGRLCDEGPLAATVARDHPNIDHVLVRNDTSPLLEAMERHALAGDGPVRVSANIAWVDAIGQEARRRGISVLLGGACGNFTISYDGEMLPASLLRQGRLLALLREARGLHRAGWSWRGLVHQTLRPFLPAELRRRILLAIGRRQPGLYDMCAINPAFARETGVEELARDLGRDLLYDSGGDGRVWRAMLLQRTDRGMTMAGLRRLFGLDMRDPTADRRVIALCLSIPEEQFLRHGEPRSLIRRAMAGILPPEILAERRRGLQSADWHAGFTAARPGMLREMERLEASPLAQRCLDLPRLRRLVENWPEEGWHRPEVKENYLLALGRGLSAGHFIRRIEGGNG